MLGALIVFLILGAIVGYVASRILKREEGLFASTAIGVVGAFLGALIAHLFNSDQPVLALNFGSIVAALVGSLIVVAALNYSQYKRVRP